jgi:hypothetical protein
LNTEEGHADHVLGEGYKDSKRERERERERERAIVYNSVRLIKDRPSIQIPIVLNTKV